MLALLEYASGSSSDEEIYTNKSQTTESTDSEANVEPPVINKEFSVQKQLQICAAPIVVPTVM